MRNVGLYQLFPLYHVLVCVCMCVRAPRAGDLRIVPWSIWDAGGPLSDLLGLALADLGPSRLDPFQKVAAG